MHFLNQRVIMVTGKGGVGRTTVSVALARAAARAGRRALLMEIAYEDGVQSAVGEVLGCGRLGDIPEKVETNLSVGHLWARTGHEGFLRTILPGAALIRAALRSRVMDKFLVAAPSMHEMGLYYHLMMQLYAKNEVGEDRYDFVVVDMPATGHTLALTSLPEILLQLIPVGPVAAALRDGQKILNNPEISEAWVVTLPEQLPVTEACELVEGLRESHVHVGGILLNRMPEDLFSEEERKALEDFLASGNYFGELSLDRIDNARLSVDRLSHSFDGQLLTLPTAQPGENPSEILLKRFEALFMEEQP